jgi:hypothetical protein
VAGTRVKRILFPLDGSELGEAVKAEVMLLQVVPPHYGIALAEGYTSHLDRISQEYIRHA